MRLDSTSERVERWKGHLEGSRQCRSTMELGGNAMGACAENESSKGMGRCKCDSTNQGKGGTLLWGTGVLA